MSPPHLTQQPRRQLGWDAFVERTYAPLLRFAVALCGPQHAKDVLHGAYLQAQSADRPYTRDEVKKAILRIENRDRRRHVRRRPHCSDAVTTLTCDAPSQEIRLMKHQSRAELLAALDQLKPEHREVIVLLHLEEHTQVQAAELLEIPRGTVATRNRLATHQLKQLLKKNRSRKASNE